MSTIERAAAKLSQAMKLTGSRQETLVQADAGPRFKLDRPEPLVVDPVYVPPGGEIDLAALTARGFVTKANNKGRLAADFRRIKRPLLLNIRKEQVLARDAAAPNPPNLILVTSAIPGEGKTFVSVNLALSIAAELDRTVLLVDADVMKDDVAQVLHLDYSQGLTDLLQQGLTPEQIILRSNVDGLRVLPAGRNCENPDELFASQAMRNLLHGLARQDPNQVVLIDAPPLMAGTIAGILGRLVGQILLVVEAEQTPRATVLEALAQLQGCPVNLMLNKSTQMTAEQLNYGYGYGASAA